MPWLTILPWAGWVVTASAWAILLYLHRRVPTVIAESSDYRCVLCDRQGKVESIRNLKTGCAPILIERGHGHLGSDWYRLSGVEGTALMYRPEPPLKK